MSLNDRIDAIVAQRVPALIALRRKLHEHPELAFEEHETAKAVTQFLADLDIPFRTGIGKTGVVAVIEGTQPGRTVGLRADMDALPIHEENSLSFASKVPGKMHACGHDAHTAIALGVAATLVEMRDTLRGRVKLIFQPAEETLSGAAAMIADGALDDPPMDVILGYHNWPQIDAGKVGYHADAVMASADAFDVTLQGRTGHGAHPHLAIDAIAAGSYFVTQLQSIVSREIAPLSPAVVTIGEFHSGTARNVIAPTAVLKGSVRTLDAGVASAIETAVRRLLDGIKTGMRVDYVLDWKRVAPALRQNAQALARVLASTRAMLGDEAVIELPQPSMGSEDFAWFAEKVPAAHLRIGSKIDGLDTAIHRSNYDCNELAIPTGVRVLTRAVLDSAAVS
ncbi:MAG TPA: M20 family metallopeptidase [Casimicrobiaceae bacterium]|nr:M20 family metallopeptidase [Casimicrobiaceae bacterium]